MTDNVETEIWNQPMKPAAQIIEEVKKEFEQCPDEISLTITLKGIGANKYHFVSKILEVGFSESPEDVAKYILRSGVEREIERVVKFMNGVKEE